MKKLIIICLAGMILLNACGKDEVPKSVNEDLGQLSKAGKQFDQFDIDTDNIEYNKSDKKVSYKIKWIQGVIPKSEKLDHIAVYMLEDNKKDVNKVEVTHEIKGQEYTVNLHREGNKFIKDEK